MEHFNSLTIFDKYPDVVGVDELCEMLNGISRKLAYRILRENQIPSLRIGREYKIAKIDVVDFVLHRKRSNDE